LKSFTIYSVYLLVFWLTNLSNASAESHAGSYLSAIHAEKKFDFVSASQFYSNGLRIEPTNQKFLLGAIRSNISSGKFDKAKFETVKSFLI